MILNQTQILVPNVGKNESSHALTHLTLNALSEVFSSDLSEWEALICLGLMCASTTHNQ